MTDEPNQSAEPDLTLPTAPTPIGAGTPPSNDSDPDDLGVPVEERLRAALGEDYELGPQIGRGGMGIVFRATDRRLKREVAVKVLPPEMTYRSDLRKRFVREAQLAAQLTHPNIVPIYDVGNRDGLVWFVMSFITGETVRDLVRRDGAQPIHVTSRVLRETAWALSYAHARHIIHRDIKPDNIMIERATGRTYVADFGLAKLLKDDQHSELTSAGGILGTPAYMSPEQAHGSEHIDHRTDIYSLGLVGYFMLAGRNPYEGRGVQAVLARVLTEAPPDISHTRPDLASWIVDSIRKATHRKPDERYQQAEELAIELDRAAAPAITPTSIEHLLDMIGSYAGFSILFAWLLWLPDFRQVPTLSWQTWFLVSAVLAFPIMRALHLVNVEGLNWSNVKSGIEARRIYWLKRQSLRNQAGPYWFPYVMVAVAFACWAGFWFLDRFNLPSVHDGQFTFYQPIERGRDVSWPVPPWGLIVYSLFGSVAWVQLFGLPRARRLTPDQLDRLMSWRLPWLFDNVGKLIFRQFGMFRSVDRRIEASADFEQLADPAVRSAFSFTRTRRSLPLPKLWKLREPIRLGSMLVRRTWWLRERSIALRKKLDEVRDCKHLAKKIEKCEEGLNTREQLIAECSATLEDLRMILLEGDDPYGSNVEADQRTIEEALRLTRPMRRVRVASRIYGGIIVSWFVVRGLIGLLSTDPDFQRIRTPEFDQVLDGIGLVCAAAVCVFFILQFFRHRLYS